MKNYLNPVLLFSCLALSSAVTFASNDDNGWSQHHNMTQPSMPGHHATMMPPMTMPPMMGGMMDMHKNGHGSQQRNHEYRPRNAAENFLGMGKMLNLSTEQKTELRKLRDDWVDNQTVPQAQLKVARTDLIHMIYSDTDSKTIDELLSKIGKLEGGLWRAFVRQYKSIIKLLDDKQRQMVLDDKYFE